VTQPLKCIMVYGVTGGRHPQMAGLAHWLNQYLETHGFEVIAHFGFSGGAIISTIMGNDVHNSEGGTEAWLRASTKYGKYGKIGGCKLIPNLWSLFTKGGLLNSRTLFNSVFKPATVGTNVTPSYAGSWCISSNTEVVFDTSDERVRAHAIGASAALPFAISPMIIPNSDLIEWGYAEQLPGIEDDPEGDSYFGDGGICSALGLGLVGDVPVVAEADLDYPVPVIGINIDHIEPMHDKDFGGKSWYKMIWEAGWGTVRANILDDLKMALEERPVFLCVAPTEQRHMKFQTKFDATEAENLEMFQSGMDQARAWAEGPIGGFDNLLDALHAAIDGPDFGTTS
jgi:hypothetical protein